MLVFVDESGCTGFKFDQGSSRHFVVVAVVFADREQAKLCDRAISDLRKELGWKPNHEFKFMKESAKTRKRFFSTIAPFSFRYYCFVLNKPRLMAGALRRKRSMYSKTVSWVFENACEALLEADVILDAHGNREFNDYVSRSLQRNTRRQDGKRCIRSVRFSASHSDNLVQLADMIAGAIRHRHAGNTECRAYHEMLQSAKKEEQWRYWPNQ